MKNKKQRENSRYYYRFSDDRMLCTVMGRDKELLRKALQLMLGVPIRKILRVTAQKVLNYRGDVKSVRLDVYLEDDTGTIYDLEMETTRDGKKLKLLPKRARLYSSLSDADRCKKGASYDDVRKTYIIFLCLHDPFGFGLARYTGSTQCKENSAADVGNEITYVYLNANARIWNVEPDLKAFLKYVAGKEHEDIELTVQIEEAVKRYNEDEEWRNWAMTVGDRIEEARVEAREEGIRIGQKRIIRRMIQRGLTDEQIQDYLGLRNTNRIKTIRRKLQS